MYRLPMISVNIFGSTTWSSIFVATTNFLVTFSSIIVFRFIIGIVIVVVITTAMSVKNRQTLRPTFFVYQLKSGLYWGIKILEVKRRRGLQITLIFWDNKNVFRS